MSTRVNAIFDGHSFLLADGVDVDDLTRRILHASGAEPAFVSVDAVGYQSVAVLVTARTRVRIERTSTPVDDDREPGPGAATVAQIMPELGDYDF